MIPMLPSAASSDALRVSQDLIDRKKVSALGTSSRPPACYRPSRKAIARGVQNTAHPPWRPRVIASPDELLEYFVSYAVHIEQHPLQEDKVFFCRGKAVHANLRKSRPLTMAGFCVFLGITPQAWRCWRKKRRDLIDAVELIEDAIFAHKFEGAAAGIFKANIISRELGGIKQI
ncbi:MAG: terminase small subunit [Limimaricola soesokkakensis]|uniref:terminase small subunit n=1 Tax=Limimaricola soesokkakensis TaxID=1343159 RepID=UPI004059AF9A